MMSETDYEQNMEERFWILKKECKTFEKVFVQFKSRVLSLYSQDPRFESILIIDHHEIKVQKNEQITEGNPGSCSLIISKNGQNIVKFYHNDYEVINSWKIKLEICSKDSCVSNIYKILETIYATEQSTVLKIQHIKTNKLYAAKILADDPNHNERVDVLNEIGIMRRLKHPNLVGLHEVYKQDNNTVLVMEYMEGGNLFENVKKYGPYEEDVAAKFMKNFLQILKYLEEENVVHKDIKPKNILLCNSKDRISIKLADFGLSSHTYFDSINKKTGTPGYVAPEILAGHEVTPKTDIYSSGLVLYFILASEPAFNGEDGITKLKNNKIGIISYNQKIWEDISEDCINFLKRFLARAPKQRPTPLEALNSFWIARFTKDLPQNLSSLFNTLPVEELQRTSKRDTYHSKKTLGLSEIKNNYNESQQEDCSVEKSSLTIKHNTIVQPVLCFSETSPRGKLFKGKVNCLSSTSDTSAEILSPLLREKRDKAITLFKYDSPEENYEQDMEENIQNVDLEERALLKFKMEKLNEKHVVSKKLKF